VGGMSSGLVGPDRRRKMKRGGAGGDTDEASRSERGGNAGGAAQGKHGICTRDFCRQSCGRSARRASAAASNSAGADSIGAWDGRERGQ
jgi:hypothetical protein